MSAPSGRPGRAARSHHPEIITRVRILGIDPGSRLTGYGIVDLIGPDIHHVTHGTFRLSNTGGKASIPLEKRLLDLFHQLTAVIDEYRPQVMSIERVFFAKNAVSALKLGQARGAAIVCGAYHGLSIVEYSPTQVKSAIVGHGQADKDQVARILELMLGKQDFVTSDASDGLALAVCHARISGTSMALQKTAQNTLTRARSSKKSSSLAESLGINAEAVAGKKRMRVSER